MKGITEPLEGKQRASVTGPGVRKNEAIVPEIDEVAETDTTPNKNDIFKYIEEYLTQNINEFIENFYFTSGVAGRLAYCKAAAGAATTIQAYLDTDGTGPEVTVNCNTNGGGNLNVSVPLLKDGQLLYVIKIGNTWYSLTQFNTGQAAIAYVKTTPGAVTSLACWFSETDGSGQEISVPCDIVGGGNLNSVISRLVDGTKIRVTKNGATWGTAPFQTSEDCVCS